MAPFVTRNNDMSSSFLQSIDSARKFFEALFVDMKMEKIRPIIKEQKNNARNTERIYHNIPSLPQQNFWSFSSQQN